MKRLFEFWNVKGETKTKQVRVHRTCLDNLTRISEGTRGVSEFKKFATCNTCKEQGKGDMARLD